MTSDLRRLEELQRANLLARPADAATIHGLALTLRDQGRFADARAEFIRAIRLDPQSPILKANFVNMLVWMGLLAEADSVFAANERQITAGGFQQPRFELAMAHGRFVEAYQYADSILRIPREVTSRQRLVGAHRMVDVAAPTGRVRDYERALAIRDSAFVRLALPGDQRRDILLRATLRFELFGDSAQFKSALDTLARDPRLPRLRPLDRTRAELAIAWARVGLPDRARRELDLHRREITMPDRGIDSVFVDRATAEIALAEGDWKRAVEFARLVAAAGRRCHACELPLLARAYERGAMPDSTIAVLERFVRSPRPTLLRENLVELPRAYKRLGELYELRGETTNAIQRYSDLVDLWKNADPELQPVVEDIQSRIATLRRKIG
jgi:tetratricopeptide (TPR) repeat protein